MNTASIMNYCSLLSSLLIVVFMVKSLIGFFTVGGRGNMKVRKTDAFKYFTVDSNMLMAAAAAITLVYNIRKAIDQSVGIPYWATLLYHVGTVAVMVTFSVVMFIFVPSTGLKFMIEGNSLYLHLISPLLALISFVCFDRGEKLGSEVIIIAAVPVLIYSVLYYYMVMVRGESGGGWKDFYHFNDKGRWYVSAVSILIMALALAAVLLIGHNHIAAEALSA